MLAPAVRSLDEAVGLPVSFWGGLSSGAGLGRGWLSQISGPGAKFSKAWAPLPDAPEPGVRSASVGPPEISSDCPLLVLTLPRAA